MGSAQTDHVRIDATQLERRTPATRGNRIRSTALSAVITAAFILAGAGALVLGPHASDDRPEAARILSDPSWSAEGDQIKANFGYSVASAGDVNNDGYSDVIIGANNYDNGETDEGRAFVYLGSSSGLSSSPDWTAESNQAYARLGRSVSTAGDVNNDGYDDVVVGAYVYDNGETDEGRAFLYLGSSTGLSSTPSWTAEGDQASAFFGSSVASAGDVNGDGYDDVLVAASFFTNGENLEGRVYLFQGSASGLPSSPSWTAEGNQAYAYFGRSVAPAGDVNNDGYDDVIIGAYYYDNGQTNEGRAFVYLGSPTGLPGLPSWTAEIDIANAWFGTHVSSAGDVNSDGYDDVLVGAVGYANGQSYEGSAYLYMGSASGLSASPAWSDESDQSSAYYGVVSSAGDVDKDGYDDVVVGAYMFDNGQQDEGLVYLYRGSSSGLSSTPSWTAEGNQTSTMFGSTVSSAGDVNGDGADDIIIGAYNYDNGQLDEGRAFVWSFEPSVAAYGLLRVTTNPAVPSTIHIDDNWASPWGLDWVKLEPGTYTLSFSDVPGFITPEPMEVEVLADETTTVVADFVPCGSLRVMTSPAVPGTIYVDGIPRNEWGFWVEIPAGTYTVSFGAVADFATPAPQTVTVTSGGYAEVTGTYVSSPGEPGPDPATYGMLRLTTSPAMPTMIYVDGHWMSPWGLDWVKLSPGTHTLAFSDVPAWITPAPSTFEILAGQTTTIDQVFEHCGSLRVITSPPLPSTIYVDGIPRNDWGIWVDVPAGTYTVSFGEVPGYVTPAPAIVVVTPYGYAEVTGTFTV